MSLPHSRGDKRRRHRAHPTGDAARMTNALKPCKPHAGVRKRGGKADLTPHDPNHPRSGILKGARAKRAPLPLSCRRRSLRDERAHLTGPPSSCATKHQTAHRREGLEDLHSRRLTCRRLLSSRRPL